MAELRDRLIRCFSFAFPSLEESEIVAADLGRLSEMDSLAGVTLVALIDEEFGVELDLKGLLDLGTFEAIQESLHQQGLASPSPAKE